MFPTVNIGGTQKYLQLRASELQEYETQVERLLKRYIKRLQWLLAGLYRSSFNSMTFCNNQTVWQMLLEMNLKIPWNPKCDIHFLRNLPPTRFIYVKVNGVAGSNRVFGTVVEKRCIFLVDTSGSMDPYMEELKRELASLIWEQIHRNRIW